MSSTAKSETGHDWRDAGEAWGHAAADWSCFYEHLSIDVVFAVFSRTGVGPDKALLDVACGAGMWLRVAHNTGAVVSGLDASAQLVEIARERTPEADVRLGSMFELPWADASFDIAISINGIWGHCADALAEVRRVLRPGGMVGITFWGFGPPADFRPVFQAIAAHSPPASVDGMRATNAIAKPGVAEDMLRDAGFGVAERGGRVSTIEWPDDDTAWRAMASVGPIAPALAHADPEVVRKDVLAALQPCRDRFGVYRYRNDQQYVIAQAT